MAAASHDDLEVTVRQARAEGRYWASIAAEVGLSREGLRKRYGAKQAAGTRAGWRQRRADLEPIVVKLRSEGSDWATIGERVGMPMSTCQRWWQELPEKPPPKERKAASTNGRSPNGVRAPVAKPKPPKPQSAPAVRPEMSPELAARVLEMHEEGTAGWTIAKRTGLRVGDVQKAISRSVLERMVQDGRLTIRFARGAELERLRRDRDRHDRRALQERDRLPEPGRKAA